MEICPHADAGHAAGIECEGVMEEVRSLSRKKGFKENTDTKLKSTLIGILYLHDRLHHLIVKLTFHWTLLASENILLSPLLFSYT